MEGLRGGVLDSSPSANSAGPFLLQCSVINYTLGLYDINDITPPPPPPKFLYANIILVVRDPALMLPRPWLILFLGSEVYPGTVKTASRYMVGFVCFKALGLESNCLQATFRSLLVPFKKRDSANITVSAVFLPLTVFDFLEVSWDTVCSVHAASNRCRGCLISGEVLYPLLSGDRAHQTGPFSSPTLENGYQWEWDSWKFYSRKWIGWTQFYEGFYGDRWGEDQVEVAVEQERLLTANCRRAGKQPDGLLDQVLNAMSSTMLLGICH